MSNGKWTRNEDVCPIKHEENITAMLVYQRVTPFMKSTDHRGLQRLKRLKVHSLLFLSHLCWKFHPCFWHFFCSNGSLSLRATERYQGHLKHTSDRCWGQILSFGQTSMPEDRRADVTLLNLEGCHRNSVRFRSQCFGLKLSDRKGDANQQLGDASILSYFWLKRHLS